ncbi:MAG: NADH-quinone oxidoreductase subunit C [Candidatus Velamenicoccus archaeovorus]
MSCEEDIRQNTIRQFDFLKDFFKVIRPRRLSAEVARDRFSEVFDFLVHQEKFNILCTITGTDEGDDLGFIYHLAREGGITLNLKTRAPKSDPVIRTITAVFPGAEIYEREIVDLFGAKVQGLRKGNRYPLTDDWPADEHPLRKDWKPANGSGREM